MLRRRVARGVQPHTSRRLLERIVAVKVELLEIHQVAELLRDGTCAPQGTRGNKLASVAIGFRCDAGCLNLKPAHYSAQADNAGDL